MGDVLVNSTGTGTLGRVAQVRDEPHEPTTVDSHVTIVRPKDGLFFPEFFGYALIAIENQIQEGGEGCGGQTELARSKLANDYHVSFPTSIPEQRRIVAILDEAFEGIATAKANAEKNLQNAREVFEGHLNAVFSQRGEGWVEKRLGDVCRRITVGHVGPMAKRYKSNGIPFLRSQNIRPFSIDLDNVVFIDEAFHSSLAKSSLEVGDIAIVRTGYPGTAAVIPESLGIANCSDLVIVRPGIDIDAHFLAAFFNSQYGKQLVLGKIVGAAQKHFNVSAAKETVIYIPPVTEQLEIIRAANEMREETQHLESLYQQKLAALDELKQSLLHQAFNGDL
ncbi:restriction endonuclease subunit S [Acidithiobacillus ferridurans]|uniref:restriction endonuclease subunit S n=1 Tax=Acidithiobacillus ferridurans TaxID=1232575 RepID=UPI0029CA7195|nr:restriction endonuclease subunit S [Acidithiobacillus ferridurans]